MTVRVAAIIPFYQRDRGILERAVRSIIAQRLAEGVEVAILVVDDSSPVPARDELGAVKLPPWCTLTVVDQPNAGPGAARNTGLDRAERDGCDLVAFLDSDDRWREDHLARAIAMLGDDADLCFDDHLRSQYADASYMTDGGRLARWLAAGVIRRDGGGALTIAAEHVLQPFLEDCLAQTSTLVLRTARLGMIRFDPELRSLGEDLLFMLTAARRARRVRLSDQVGVDCGEGVNIYHSALSWNHPDAPLRFASSLLLWNRVAHTVALDAADRRYVAAKIAGFRRGFAFILARSLIRDRRLHHRAIELLRTRLGWGYASLAPGLAGALLRRAAGRPPFPEH